MSRDMFGGRVLVGEDSEEDEEEDEELHFNLGASIRPAAPSTSSTPQAKFSVPIAADAANELDSSEDDEEKEKITYRDDNIQAHAPSPDSKEAAEPKDSKSEPKIQDARKAENPTEESIALKDLASWKIDPAVDGVAMMSNALVHKMRPSLDSTVRRICELTETQERLLFLLAAQHTAIRKSEQLDQIDATMSKLPLYVRKVQDMKNAMAEIKASLERMKKRSESLRVDAQSHAIKKETMRDSRSQWNKLFAAKEADTVPKAT